MKDVFKIIVLLSRLTAFRWMVSYKEGILYIVHRQGILTNAYEFSNKISVDHPIPSLSFLILFIP